MSPTGAIGDDDLHGLIKEIIIDLTIGRSPLPWANSITGMSSTKNMNNTVFFIIFFSPFY